MANEKPMNYSDLLALLDAPPEAGQGVRGELPDDIRARIEQDAAIYGTGFAEQLFNGTWRRLNPSSVVVAVYNSQAPVTRRYGVPRFSPKSKVREFIEKLNFSDEFGSNEEKDGKTKEEDPAS